MPTGPTTEYGRAVKVQIKRPLPSKILGRKFWLGIHPHSPIHEVSVGGVSFPRVLYRANRDPASGTVVNDIPSLGAVVHLSDDDVERVRNRVGHYWVRQLGEKYAEVVVDDIAGFMPHTQDEPLARHLYMIEVPEGTDPEVVRLRYQASPDSIPRMLSESLSAGE